MPFSRSFFPSPLFLSAQLFPIISLFLYWNLGKEYWCQWTYSWHDLDSNSIKHPEWISHTFPLSSLLPPMFLFYCSLLLALHMFSPLLFSSFSLLFSSSHPLLWDLLHQISGQLIISEKNHGWIYQSKRIFWRVKVGVLLNILAVSHPFPPPPFFFDKKVKSMVYDGFGFFELHWDFSPTKIGMMRG